MRYKSDYIGIVFYILMSLLLGANATIATMALWQANQAGLALVVALLMVGQIGLLWLNAREHERRHWWLFYYSTQTALIIVLTLLLARTSTNEVSYLGSAALCLIGEALGLWGNTRKALLLGLFYAGLALAIYALILNQNQYLMVLTNLVINGSFIILLLVSFNQQQIERQKALELAESLESANAMLAASAAKIETLTLQTERERMARELHDTLAQGLAGLVLQLEAAKAHLGNQRPERAAAIVEQALARARSTLAESRAAIDDLRLSKRSFLEAMQEQIERFRQATGLACSLDIAPEAEDILQSIADQSLQIVGEALTNIERHAHATQVEIRCSIQQQQFELIVADNGQGFDAQQPVGSGHYGVLGMHERARLMGGSLEIESSERGTRVVVRVTSDE